MPSNIQSRPIKTGCPFNAVGNPIVYKFRREDYQYDQINDNGGDAQIQIDGIDLTTYFEVDDTVYVEGIGSVIITASAFSGGNTLITVDFPFDATDTGYINNLSKRTDYAILVEIFDAASDEALAPKLSVTPMENGEVKCDVSGILKSFVSAEWNDILIDSDSTIDPDEEVSKEFFIKYQDFYDVTLFTQTSDMANPIVAVFAVMHLLMNSPTNFTRYAHGGNLLSYFPEDDTRLFLTRFNPVYWRSWPFTLSFIWPDGIGVIERRVKQYDSEGNELSDTNTDLSGGTIGKINRMNLGSVNAAATSLLVSLEEVTSPDNQQITAELPITVKDPCDNPVLLVWKNSVGGDAFWMFDETQDYAYTYPNGRVTKRLVLSADDLTVEQWDGINQLNSVSQVIAQNNTDYNLDDSIDKTHFRNDNQVYIVTQSGEKTGVIVIATDNRTKTSQRKHSIEITIELPEFFTI